MTRPTGERIDLIDTVRAVRVAGANLRLTPEQARVLARCEVPVPLVELGADLGLAIGVVRILVSDLRERGLVTIQRARPAGVSDLTILQQVAEGLRRL
jgi:DNA-binding MarR family transcriptional regulator